MKPAFYLILSFLPVLAFSQSAERKVSNITAFARLYGYTRYFHPSEEAAGLNWNDFVYHGIKSVENSKNDKELIAKLRQLFNPIAPSVTLSENPSLAFSIANITPKETGAMKDIYWQHYGMGGAGGLYKSNRSHRPMQVGSKLAGFGTATRSVDAKPLQGKQFRLRSMIKTDGSSAGTGQMWARVDRPKNKMGFFDNMDSRPVRKTSWGEYEISGKVDEDAVVLAFGVFLNGDGKVWADNFILEYNEQGKWQKMELANASFEDSDKEAKEWYTKSPSYTYEIVNEGVQGNRALLIRDDTKYEVKESIFNERPAFGEYLRKEIGSGITALIPLVLKGTDKSTYPSAESAKLDELKKSIQASVPSEMTGKDVYTRLAGIVIGWNIFRHFYPYQDEIPTNWDSQLSPTLTAAYNAQSEDQYLSLLKTFTEKLKDGHVSVSPPSSAKRYYVPAAATLAEGKIVIDQIDSVASTKPGALKLGDVILEVNGKPAMERLAELKSEVSGSEQWKNNRALTDFFGVTSPKEVRLTVQRDGEGKKELIVIPGDYYSSRQPSEIKKVENDFYYINIGSTSMDLISSALPNLSKAKGLICDLRGYPHGNHMLIAHLLTTNDTNKWMFVPRITQPDYEKVTYDSLGWEMKPAKPHLNAKVVFLTGGGAISYAESYMGFIKQYKLATIVGAPTAGANGNVNLFTLPGNYKIRFTGMKVRQQDGSPLHGIGIQPDVPVRRTIKAIAEGRDEEMEKAVEVLRSQI